jgi:hypothetical protein
MAWVAGEFDRGHEPNRKKGEARSSVLFSRKICNKENPQ